jgi:hypothetical protein
MESESTSVELPNLITHLYRGERGVREIICTGEWVELPSPISWHAESRVISTPFKSYAKKATTGRRFGPEYFQDELVTSDTVRPGPVPTRQVK